MQLEYWTISPCGITVREVVINDDHPRTLDNCANKPTLIRFVTLAPSHRRREIAWDLPAPHLKGQSPRAVRCHHN